MTDTDVPHPTTLGEIRDLAVLPVFSKSGPSLAGLLGKSRYATYKDVQLGRWPSIPNGSRVLIPVPALRRVLGDLDPEVA